MKTFSLFACAVFALAMGCVSVPSQQTGQMQYGGMMRSGEIEIPIERSIASLAEAIPSKAYELEDGETFQLEVRAISKEIGGNSIRMLAYNGQIPGPLLKAKQGSSIYANFKNEMEYETTVHWHGIRLENKYDGVPDITQRAVKKGESFLYKLDFPDAGMFWYHPHVKESMQQELGLYGAIIVEPNKSGYYGSVSREEIIILDDIFLSGNDVYPYDGKKENFALMGRYGNVMLVNGKENYQLLLGEGEKVRFYILNAANVRPFNLSIEGAKLHIIGADNEKYASAFAADSIVISPSERYVIESDFGVSGDYEIRSITPYGKRILGKIIVSSDTGNIATQDAPKTNPGNPEILEYLEKHAAYLTSKPDFEYVLDVEINGVRAMSMMGMMHSEEGIEWEDTMLAMNSYSTNESVRWIIKDLGTGRENMDAVYTIRKSAPYKIRIKNEIVSVHPMQHSMHIHGARFLVLSENGKPNANMAWKDTVNIPTGEEVELLVEFPNKGEWMMHCHIAEHLGAGMMTSFMVE